MLTQEAIKEFQKIYFAEYGETLAFEQAAAKAESLLRLYKSVLKPSINKGPCDESNDHTSTITQS